MQKYARNMKYRICKKYAQICKYENVLKYAKSKYVYACKHTTCINMHKICTNMKNKICINMHFQNMHKHVFYMHKYALYAWICRRVKMPLSAFLNMHKYASNMHKLAKICSGPRRMSPVLLWCAFICTKCAKICTICKHESHMQNMQKYAPALLIRLQFSAAQAILNDCN